MPRPIVTKDLVFEAADALLAEGKEPTLILIKERIGGGSYSTIKPHLNAWNEQRKAQPIAIPDDIQRLGRDLMRAMWNAALTHDEVRIAQTRAEAQHQLESITEELNEAKKMIEHLEGDNEDRQRQADEAHTDIVALRASLDEAQAAAEMARVELAQARANTKIANTRADALEQQVADVRADLALAHAQALVHAQQAGELAALRQQVQQQSEVIERLAARQVGEQYG